MSGPPSRVNRLVFEALWEAELSGTPMHLREVARVTGFISKGEWRPGAIVPLTLTETGRNVARCMFVAEAS
jgi:hypothetical protein